MLGWFSEDQIFSPDDDRIVTTLPESKVQEPPEANAPPIVSAALLPTAAAADIPSASKA